MGVSHSDRNAPSATAEHEPDLSAAIERARRSEFYAGTWPARA
jgi:hypothetical protein